MPELTKEEHRLAHIGLHKAFDTLLADFIRHSDKLPSETTTTELLVWSYEQAIKPTE